MSGAEKGRHRGPVGGRQKYRARHRARRESHLVPAASATGALALAAIAAAAPGTAQARTLPAPNVLRPAITTTLTTQAHRAATAQGYTVRRGDTLSSIAGHLFGDPGKWPYLYDANRSVVGADPDQINPGEVLRAALGSRPAYGAATTLASYRSGGYKARHAAAASGDGDGLAPGGAYCKPDCWGDGDLDGYDLNHSPWQSAPAARSAGHHAYRHAYRLAASSGSYGNVSASSYSGFQACVIRRESGGNSQVMNSSGHYGLYQFSASTWQAYGGSAATFGHASVAEQNRIFANAMAQGGQNNWSPYDGC